MFHLKVTLNPSLSNRNDLEIPGYLPFYLFIRHCPNAPLHLKSEFTHQHCNTPGKMMKKTYRALLLDDLENNKENKVGGEGTVTTQV